MRQVDNFIEHTRVRAEKEHAACRATEHTANRTPHDAGGLGHLGSVPGHGSDVRLPHEPSCTTPFPAAAARLVLGADVPHVSGLLKEPDAYKKAVRAFLASAGVDLELRPKN